MNFFFFNRALLKEIYTLKLLSFFFSSRYSPLISIRIEYNIFLRDERAVGETTQRRVLSSHSPGDEVISR